ncbi:patatin domain-containing protein, partial [Acinetobacter baumannii]
DRTVVALHGRGDFERIEADSRDVNGQRFVHLQLSEAPWSENRIRIGLELYSNFAEANRFSLVALHVADWLNSWGAEWRTLARIGSQRSL